MTSPTSSPSISTQAPSERLLVFLKSDRQWRRERRIEHAVFQLRRAVSKDDQEFWRAVIAANDVDLVVRPPWRSKPKPASPTTS